MATPLLPSYLRQIPVVGDTIGGYDQTRRGRIDPATQKLLADCSYFVGRVLKASGLDVDPATVTTYTAQQILPKLGFSYQKFDRNSDINGQLQPGDILWKRNGDDDNHMAFYVGNGKIAQVGGGNNPNDGSYWFGDTNTERFTGYYRPSKMLEEVDINKLFNFRDSELTEPKKTINNSQIAPLAWDSKIIPSIIPLSASSGSNLFDRQRGLYTNDPFFGNLGRIANAYSNNRYFG